MSSFNSVRFGCTSLVGTNKAGMLKPDGDGYYPMVIGALGMYNSAGEFYDYEQAKRLFEGSSHFMRRVQRGVLKGEYGHPKMEVGMKPDDFARRVMTVYEANISHHIREVWLEFDKVKGADGKPVIAIMAWVKPSGPMARYLQDSIDNKCENVCFSIRAFTDDRREGGIKKRILKTIVTFDYVLEPGMSVAEKYKAPALESFHETTISRNELERALSPSSMVPEVAMESVRLTADELFTSMGWNVSRQERPAFTRW
jgi:hypothetical protein